MPLRNRGQGICLPWIYGIFRMTSSCLRRCFRLPLVLSPQSVLSQRRSDAHDEHLRGTMTGAGFASL